MKNKFKIALKIFLVILCLPISILVLIFLPFTKKGKKMFKDAIKEKRKTLIINKL